MGTVLSIASSLIISTNLLVAAALLKLLLKKCSQSWCFVFNLALADILVGVAITGLAVEDFNSNVSYGHRPLNATPSTAQAKTRCLMRMAFVISPCIASIMSMFLISLDRYAAIKIPLRYSLLSGKGTAAGSLLVLWITSLTMGFMPVMVRQLQTETSYDGFCAFFSVIHNLGIIIFFSIFFFPVLAIFIYIYLDILKIASSHQKQICRVRQASSWNADHHHNQHQHHPHHPHRSHVKALRTVAVLVGCFLALWCPFFVVSIVHILCKRCALKVVIENHVWLLGLSNSLINPVVYAIWQREVRLQLAAMFSCITGRSLAASAAAVTERSDPQPHVQTQACASGGDTQNPSLLQPITNNEDHAAPQSATTSV
ncbi:glucose-dependent insulinotropic receptor [Archocentrus centrarchus]|uniref:glucose-dependent insulinotropic receptor n=1 Tax=Archocentrus centrarchus TaxID=63155 RepID=UPI0011EA0FF7|nr:glucose-dependent insulinotropic receptor [Archocentrus centrarchus]